MVSPVLANLFLHWAFDAWMVREFPDCPFERYADDGLVHCKSQARARQVLAALEQRMRDVGLELHPDKTRIIYCRDSRRRQRQDGPVSFDFLGYAFRPRDTLGKNGKFTGFDLAVSPKAVKRMSEIVSGWQLHRHVDLTWEQLAGWIGPVIRGWMAYYGRFRHSALHPLLARINHHVQKWIRAKYRRLRPFKAMLRAWNRVTTQMPGLLPHWRWETMARYKPAGQGEQEEPGDARVSRRDLWEPGSEIPPGHPTDVPSPNMPSSRGNCPLVHDHPDLREDQPDPARGVGAAAAQVGISALSCDFSG